MTNSNGTRGYISLWKNSSENENAPILKGTIEITPELLDYINDAWEENATERGLKLTVSIWQHNKSDNENAPQARGTIEPMQKKEKTKASTEKRTMKKRSGAARIL